ncbi:hypothetical protein [Myxococcus qinghaiensis]|nr:hypothetical protein [Myxococcus qinghaiensis]MCP3162483.1 hypothetical protein [Myxococcus qinghaiensis]
MSSVGSGTVEGVAGASSAESAWAGGRVEALEREDGGGTGASSYST